MTRWQKNKQTIYFNSLVLIKQLPCPFQPLFLLPCVFLSLTLCTKKGWMPRRLVAQMLNITAFLWAAKWVPAGKHYIRAIQYTSCIITGHGKSHTHTIFALVNISAKIVCINSFHPTCDIPVIFISLSISFFFHFPLLISSMCPPALYLHVRLLLAWLLADYNHFLWVLYFHVPTLFSFTSEFYLSDCSLSFSHARSVHKSACTMLI